MSAALAQSDVLLLDCQATGASPVHGELLELGWAQARAADPVTLRVETRLVRPQSSAALPRPVQRVTGISPADLRRASHPRQVWRELASAAARIAAGDGASVCRTVVHFARFEEPFLRSLHASWSGGTPFPLELHCTRRLLPTLPRKGLRALAGYFGSEVPELRRAGDHVTATALVWRELVRLLEEREGVGSFEALRDWLERDTAPARRPGRYLYPLERELRRAAPDSPGVYRLCRRNGDVLYVGKARSLRRRVNSYFQKRRGHAERTLEMLTQAQRLDLTVTETALEAALLESDEIKRLSPPYNVALRERGRRLAFWSAELQSVAARADSRHQLGPFPSRDSLSRLAALAQLLRRDVFGPAELELGAAALGLPGDRPPDPAALREGLDSFRAHRIAEDERLPIRLLWLGARLEQERPGGVAPEPEDAESQTVDAVWTPERVRDALDEAVRESARLTRRARWLCRLAECSLAWEEAGRVSLLVLSAGRLLRRAPLAPGGALPPPPGHARTLAQRQRAIDLVSYDRLSALTRELRSQLARGGFVELRLSPQRSLDPSALRAALR